MLHVIKVRKYRKPKVRAKIFSIVVALKKQQIGAVGEEFLKIAFFCRFSMKFYLSLPSQLGVSAATIASFEARGD